MTPRCVLPTITLAVAALSAACTTTTGPTTMAALREADPVRIEAVEMDSLLPGARVVYTNPQGVSSVWWNDPDGSLTATQDRTSLVTVSGTGQWWIRADADDPVYCISIMWESGTSPLSLERTCHGLWRVGDEIYGASAYAPGSQRLARYRFQRPFGQPPARR